MGYFKVSIVGSLTSAQFIVTTNKYLVHSVALTNILDFYKSNNPCYKHVEITTPLEGVSSYIFNVLYVLISIISKHYLTFSPFWTIIYSNSIIDKLDVLDTPNTLSRLQILWTFQKRDIPIPF
jgi:hypothetical protein